MRHAHPICGTILMFSLVGLVCVALAVQVRPMLSWFGQSTVSPEVFMVDVQPESIELTLEPAKKPESEE